MLLFLVLHFWFVELLVLFCFFFFSLQDGLNICSEHFSDSLDPAQIHRTNILLPQEPRGSVICGSFHYPGSRFKSGCVWWVFLEEGVFIREMLQQNLSKVCGGLCPKATKPAFSSGLGFFSTLTNFVSQHPWEGKYAFCSFINRRRNWDVKIPVLQQEAALGGNAPWGEGGFWVGCPGYPSAPAHLTHPILLSQIYSPQSWDPQSLGSAASAGRQRIYLPLTSLGNYFLFLSSLPMALPSLPPLASFKAFISTDPRGVNRLFWSRIADSSYKRGRFMSLAQVCPGSLWQRFASRSPTSRYN